MQYEIDKTDPSKAFYGASISAWDIEAQTETSAARLTVSGQNDETTIRNSKIRNGSKLTVAVSPAGGGTVAVDPQKEEYAFDEQLTLRINPSEGFVFDGLTSPVFGDPGLGNQFDVDWFEDEPMILTARFINGEQPGPLFTLTVTKQGSGSGTVTGNPAGIDCGEDCSVDYPEGAQVTLTPAPDTGSIFTGWSGDCSNGQVAMTSDKTCIAVFTAENPEKEAPDKPVLISPADTSLLESLTPEFVTGVFSDPTGDAHLKSIWQAGTVSTEVGFEDNLVFQLETTRYLTGVEVPDLILDQEQTYSWRVRFIDDKENESPWSDIFSFTTPARTGDEDGDGIMNEDRIAEFVDLDDDGTDDNLQKDVIKSFRCLIADKQIGVKKSTGVFSVDMVRPVDPETLPITAGKPASLPFGLVSFRLTLAPGSREALVTIHFSEPLPSATGWYKYNPANGWYDCSDQAVFNEERTAVTLTLEDGGTGDADGVVNGIIVDPSGPGGGAGGNGDFDAGIDDDDSPCFISGTGAFRAIENTVILSTENTRLF